MKYLIPIVLIVTSCLTTKAQQDPQFNKYMFNPLIINPAYAGSRDAVSIVVLHRSQWMGFDGAPSTQTLSIHAPFWHKRIGLGLSVIHDQIGPSRSIGIMGSYSYRIRIWKGKLAFGLRTAFYNYIFDWDRIDYREAGETTGTTTHWVPSFDFGIRYYTKKLYAGIVVSHLNQPNIGVDLNTPTLQYDSKLTPFLVATFGYAWAINRDLVFKPSVFYKYSQGNPGVFDINASVLWKKKLWVGVSFRTSLSMVAMVEYNLTKFMRIGFSYDFTLNKLIDYNAGSVEAFIGFDLHPKKSKMLSPRYF